MAKKQLHPSVEQFKEFVKGNPAMIKQVRAGNSTWQELYEEWYLLGEEDSKWASLGKEKDEGGTKEDTESKQPDWMENVMGSLKKMDVNQMQGYIANMSQALAAIQGVISQFQGGSSPKGGVSSNSSQQKPNPFTFNKD
ncbi:YlbD family protein [Cytobacillus purgationiresistens]|uniref:Coat protein YlbD-like n=1 Tax=Cytobacillus purgationiresistens TaxID=863449 RepID=A0ABU0AMA8_9BACI|nr:YlbD family protein [Cytobacillus purgationiresistens]MDQ0272397.1 hypothetical protein [Cytobacillus purgationiresistens]